MKEDGDWHLVPQASLPEVSKVKRVSFHGNILCLANVAGEIHALDDVCPHAAASLGRGKLEGNHVICPAHKLKISVVDGTDLRNVGYQSRVFPVRKTENGWEIKVVRKPSWWQKLLSSIAHERKR